MRPGRLNSADRYHKPACLTEMAKKKGLPFVVKPRLAPIKERIGTEETGIFEIERRGYLSVAEKAFAQAAQMDDDSVFKMQALAVKISTETGVDREQVIEDLTSNPGADYLAPYQDELSQLMMAMITLQEKIKFIQATALLFSRIDPEWTVEQTLDLPLDIVDELSILYMEEEAKDISALQAAFESEEQVQKKGKS